MVSCALQAHSADIVRCKGTVAVHGHASRFIFQGVHETLQMRKVPPDANPERAGAAAGGADEPAAAAPAPQSELSEVVFIGRNLNQDEIQQGFATCVWREAPPGWDEHVDPARQRRCAVCY
jgi:G3E family GTPase